MTDTDVIDAVTELLRNAPDWGADHLEGIADLIGEVRPHPGDQAQDS